MFRFRRTSQLYPIYALLVFLATGCNFLQNSPELTVNIDGSSTVNPITEATIRAFKAEHTGMKFYNDISGTSGGFQRFCRGELDFANASRKITDAEIKLCRDNDVAYLEIPVGLDGIAVVANSESYWLDYLTVDELRKIWALPSEGEVTHWSQIRSEWPNERIRLFGPSSASGTYDYFSDAVLETTTTRGDYFASENDRMLVDGVASSRYAIGFFGFTHFRENFLSLKIVPIEDGRFPDFGPVTPTVNSVTNGSYKPLSRTLYIYASLNALQNQKLLEFLEYYLIHAAENVTSIGNIPHSDKVYKEYLAKIDSYRARLPK